MSKKKTKKTARSTTSNQTPRSKKKTVRKTAAVKRHSPPSESELVRSELALASLYAEVYFRRTGKVPDAPVDESWKDAPVLRLQKNNRDVSVRWLEKHDRFGVAVPASYSNDNGAKPKRGLEWLTFLPELEGSALTRDLLLALDWTPSYLGVSSGHMRYEFSRAGNEADDQSRLLDLIHREILSYQGKRSTSRTFRPVFPALSGFELISFDLLDLPTWALRENWLVKKLIVSPVEFRRMRGRLVVETRHLLDYASWILSRRQNSAHRDRESFKAEVHKEIQSFIELLAQAEGESDLLFSRHDNSSKRKFSSEDTAMMLGIPIESGIV